jgi:hypothetical protein
LLLFTGGFRSPLWPVLRLIIRVAVFGRAYLWVRFGIGSPPRPRLLGRRE